MSENTTKTYGLKDPKALKRPAIFNSDSDSETEEKPTGITALKKKERIAQQKAIDEDPTIYQYDELYDDIQNQRKESKLARKDLDKKPKYINKLLESAERRKRENERRIERQVQKERDEEGDMYKDKESFVTSAYKKKLEELKELEEKEKREEYLEAIGDVRKQGDLSGFYRHLYAQKVNYEEEDIKQEKLKEKEKEIEKEREVEKDKETKTQARKYRKRKDDAEEDVDDKKDTKLEHLQSNIDADSDFSIDSESSDSDSGEKPEKETKKRKMKKDGGTSSSTTDETKPDKCENTETKNDADAGDVKEVEDVKEDKDSKEDEEIEAPPKKPKIDIWKKRTVGEVFDEALKRFYERKAAKIQSV